MQQTSPNAARFGCGNLFKGYRLAHLLLCVVLAAPGWLSESCAQTNLPRVGVITMGTASDTREGGERAEYVRRVLADQGWIDGKTVRLELRDSRGDAARFPEIPGKWLELLQATCRSSSRVSSIL